MTNQLTVTLVVVFLGCVALLSLGLTFWLIHDGTSDAALILAVSSPGTTALGAVAAMLVTTRVAPAAPVQAGED